MSYTNPDNYPNSNSNSKASIFPKALRNYFYLTLCLLIGIGISIGLFYYSLQFERQRLGAQFNREGDQLGYTIDLLISNQSIRMHSLEDTLATIADAPMENENLLRAILRSSVFRKTSYLELKGVDSYGNPDLRPHWIYRPDTEPSNRWEIDRPNSTVNLMAKSLLRDNKKHVVFFHKDASGSAQLILLIRTSLRKTFFYSFTTSPSMLFASTSHLGPGTRLLIEQKPDKSFWLLEKGANAFETRSLTTEERDQLLHSGNSVSVYESQNSDSFSFVLLNRGGQAFQLGWPLVVLLSGLLITGLLSTLIFKLITRNIEVQKMVTEKTLHLAEESERAQRASYAKTRFLANVSHEIRTPLNMILGMADLLRETHLTLKQANYVDNFRNAGNHLLHLINDILEMAKIDTDEIEFHPTPTSIVETLESLCLLAKAQAHWKGLELRFDFDPLIPKTVNIEAPRLRQVIINLLNNAVKFTDKGFVELRAALVTKGKDQNRIEISVKDSGVGIPKAQLDEIFRPFFQVNSSLTRNKSGVGLGLSLVERIVSRLGGTIRATSKVNVGSEFVVTVPLEVIDSGPWISKHKASRTKDGKTPKILLLSDDRDLKSGLEKYLGSAGYQFETAGESLLLDSDARTFFKPYSHVLFDQNLISKIPEKTLNTILKPKRNLFLLALSKDSQSSEDNERLRSRFSKTLERPVLPTILFSILKSNQKETKPDVLPVYSDKNLSIVVVDDDVGNRVLLKAYLEKMNYNVRMATEGQEALDLCLVAKPDILVADLQMPNMDGFALIEKLRELQKSDIEKTKVVILTADALEETAQHARAMKVDAYLTKPVRKADFLTVIDDLATI